jgi:hypothetical protein
MTNYRFNDTLKELKDNFDTEVPELLLAISTRLFSVARIALNYQLSETAKNQLESLCTCALVSSHRKIDAVCLVLFN